MQAVFDTHYDAVYKYIRYLTNDPQVTHDFVQETFYRFFQKNYASHERMYLLKIARNLVADHCRKQQLISSFEIRDEPAATAKLPEEVVLQNAELERLYDALQQMKWQYREIVVLRYIEEYSVQETAAILNCNETKVKNQTARGLKALRALLGGDADE